MKPNKQKKEECNHGNVNCPDINIIAGLNHQSSDCNGTAKIFPSPTVEEDKRCDYCKKRGCVKCCDCECHYPQPEVEGWEELMEKLADIEHQRWADWQQHVHSKCSLSKEGLAIPMNLIDRWNEQICTPYAELSEEDKEKDREQVRRYLPLIKDFIISILPKDGDVDMVDELYVKGWTAYRKEIINKIKNI